MNDRTLLTDHISSRALTAAKRTVADLWNEVLRSDTPPKLTDNFFAVGGDSMAMVTLEFRIMEQLGVQLAPGTVLSAPTLGELSSIVDSLLQPSVTECAPVV